MVAEMCEFGWLYLEINFDFTVVILNLSVILALVVLGLALGLIRFCLLVLVYLRRLFFLLFYSCACFSGFIWELAVSFCWGWRNTGISALLCLFCFTGFVGVLLSGFRFYEFSGLVVLGFGGFGVFWVRSGSLIRCFLSLTGVLDSLGFVLLVCMF